MVREAQRIDKRDGRSLPRPHTPTVPPSLPSCDESNMSVASMATINPRSKRMNNLENFLKQTQDLVQTKHA